MIPPRYVLSMLLAATATFTACRSTSSADGAGASPPASDPPAARAPDSGAPAIASVSPEARDALAAANNAFALDLYARLREAPGDLVFSPASISLAFGMTHAGARGETAAEMARALRLGALPPDEIQAGFAGLLADWNDPERTSFTLRVANRLFGDRGTVFHEPFLAITRDRFGAALEPLDFRGAPEPSRQRINEWVEERTEDKIRKLLPPRSITPDTRLTLTNAIYFKGTWLREFDEDATVPMPFRSGGSAQEVPTMHQIGRFGHARLDGLQILRLPYVGEELAMFVLLPDGDDGLGDLESRMTPETLEGWIGAVGNRDVEVLLPRFTIEPGSAIRLKGILGSMGMELAFGRGADFTGISDEQPLFISDVYHKAFVEVNEEGTEAAAATGVVMTTESARPEPTVFRADHPFVFAIRDLRSGSLLFLGRVVRPGL